MRKYGDFSELSENDVQEIGKIITEIERKNSPCSLFYGFPLIELYNSSTIMKGCIISSKGVLILHRLDDSLLSEINKGWNTLCLCPNCTFKYGYCSKKP